VQNNTKPSDSPPADHHGEESLVGGAMIVDSALDDVLNASFSDDSESEESSDDSNDEKDEGEVN
jgi:hypothetical protein